MSPRPIKRSKPIPVPPPRVRDARIAACDHASPDGFFRCGAPVGEPCKRPNGRPRLTCHSERVRAAELMPRVHRRPGRGRPVRLQIDVTAEVAARIDAARGEASRSAWGAAALERALDPGPEATADA